MIDINDLICDRYRIKALIGHGGMGDVYEAQDIIMKRSVAFKILSEESMKNHENVVRFENEAFIAASLSHPNIVKIYDYDYYGKQPFIVNEYQKGQTLKDALTFKRYFPLPEACQIMMQILDAAENMHEKGIIHRDIKPQNIFYGSDGLVKVSDFGISIIEGKELDVDERKKVVGTAQYLAPEVIRGKPASAQSDIYSITVSFFELVTGYLPFDGTNVNKIAIDHVRCEFPSPLNYMPNLPKKFEEIIAKGVAKDLNIRYKSAAEMKKDVIDLYENKESMKKSTPFFQRIFGFKKKNKI